MSSQGDRFPVRFERLLPAGLKGNDTLRVDVE
jgi:hypothetical protein